MRRLKLLVMGLGALCLAIAIVAHCYLGFGAALILYMTGGALLLPAPWDPAIRIKDAQMEAGTHPESPDRACAGCGNAFSCMYPDCKEPKR